MTSDQYSFFLKCDAFIKNFRPKNVCGLPSYKGRWGQYIYVLCPP